jgi:hypothetical protein
VAPSIIYENAKNELFHYQVNKMRTIPTKAGNDPPPHPDMELEVEVTIIKMSLSDAV